MNTALLLINSFFKSNSSISGKNFIYLTGGNFLTNGEKKGSLTFYWQKTRRDIAPVFFVRYLYFSQAIS